MEISRRQFIGAAGAAGLAAGAGLSQSTSYLTGIDVSKWQGTVNWNSVRNSGHVFAFCKATEGVTYTDPNFSVNWRGMKIANLIRGAYHFGRPGTSATGQADHFIKTVGPASGDLQMVLDLETTDGKTPAQVWAWAQAFLARVQKRTGRPGIIYCGYYFWRDSVGNPSTNLNCPLWLPQYTTAANPSLVPSAWSTWSFWQHSSTGTCPGISGAVDLNRWHGTLTNLKKLCLT